MRFSFWPAVLVAALGAIVGCADTGSTSSAVVYTSIYVEPATFKGDLVCAPSQGAMQSYVATLFDVTEVDEQGRVVQVRLPSSPPTPCGQRAAFGAVVPGHLYRAEIDVYDVPACASLPAGSTAECLLPLGTDPAARKIAASSGARTMVIGGSDPATTTPDSVVTPRWRTACGTADARLAYYRGQQTRETELAAPTEAVYLAQVLLSSCVPVRVDQTSGGVVVRGADIDRSRWCAQGRQLSAVVGGEGAAEQRVSCDGSGPSSLLGDVLFDGLTPGRELSLSALVYDDAKGGVIGGTLCSGVPAAGTIVTATCGSLTDRGSLRVPARCEPGGDRAEVSLSGGATQLTACGGEAVFRDLPMGAQTARVTTLGADGAAMGSIVCDADVLPAQQRDAHCP